MPTIVSPTVSNNSALLKGVGSNPAAGSATQVPPGILALPAGTVLRGDVAQIDGRGNAVLSTAKGDVSLQTELPLKLGSEIALRLTTSTQGIQAKIISINGLSPQEFNEKSAQPRGQNTQVDDIVQTGKQSNAARSAASSSSNSQATTNSQTSANVPLQPATNVKLPADVALRGILLSRSENLPQILQQLPNSIALPIQRLEAGATVNVKLVQNSIVLPQAQTNSQTTQATTGQVSTSPVTPSAAGTVTTQTATNATNPATTATPPATGQSATTTTATTPATTQTPSAASPTSTNTAAASAANTSTTPTSTNSAGTGTNVNAATGAAATASANANITTGTQTTQTATTNTNVTTTNNTAPTSTATVTGQTTGTTGNNPTTTTTTNQAANVTPNATTTTPNATATSTTAPSAVSPSITAATNNTAPPNLIAQGQLTAQVIGHEQSGATVVKTALGAIKVSIPSGSGGVAQLPIGTQFTLQLESINLPQAQSLGQNIAAQISNAPAPLSELSINWRSLQETVELLAQVQPAIAAQVLDNVIPKPGAKMATSMLFFLSALRGGDVGKWLGDDAIKILEQNNRSDLIRKLTTEFGTLRQFFTDSPSPNWQAAFVPVHDGTNWQQARMFLKKEPQGADAAESGGTRFIMEVELSKMGPMQFDGLVRKRAEAVNFDLIIRSRNTLSDADRQNIRDIYESSSELTGFNGGISFQVTNPFPVLPMQDILADAPDVMA